MCQKLVWNATRKKIAFTTRNCMFLEINLNIKKVVLSVIIKKCRYNFQKYTCKKFDIKYSYILVRNLILNLILNIKYEKNKKKLGVNG